MLIAVLSGKLEVLNLPIAQESNLITLKACKMQNWEAAVNKECRTIYKTPFILKDNAEFSDHTPFHF